MPISVGLIYDLIFVVILVLTALHGRRQGLVAGLVSLAGAVVGVAASVWAAGQMAPAIWPQHVGAAVSQGVADAVTAQGETLTQALNQYPAGFIDLQLVLFIFSGNLDAAVIAQVGFDLSDDLGDSIGGKLHLFAFVEVPGGLDQADGTDLDQIIIFHAKSPISFYRHAYKTQIILYQTVFQQGHYCLDCMYLVKVTVVPIPGLDFT